MGLEDVPRCQHVKVNGTQCGSPALRRKRRCYFHEAVRVERARAKADQFAQRRFVMPVLEDANAVQVALMNVMQMLARGQMEVKIAGMLLYGLQTASVNLRYTNFEAEKVTDVVIDRGTVEQTCIHGPQWFAHEFAEPEELELEEDIIETEEVDREDVNQEDAEALAETETSEETERGELLEAGGKEVLAEMVRKPVVREQVVEPIAEKEVGRTPVAREKMRPSARRVQRKRAETRNLDDEPNSLAKLLLQRMGLPFTDEEAGVEAG
jgi:hypothetical protein